MSHLRRVALFALLMAPFVVQRTIDVRTRGRVTSPKGGVRPRLRRRLLPRELPSRSRAYWQQAGQRIAIASRCRSIGKTAEGARSADGDRDVAGEPREPRALQDISRRLALAEGLTDAQARALAEDGKAVVWIDGGLHASETLGAQQLGEMVYRDGQPHRRRDDADS